MKLSLEQKQVHFDTWEHIHEVQKLLYVMQVELGLRALLHDQSKIYSEEECETFAHYTPKLAGITYGSLEYKQALLQMQSAITHHYKNNPHHPEYHSGIDNMTLIDLIEMLCDWKAATLRHNDGDIMKSLEINRHRFGISDQLYSILCNTVSFFEVQK